MISLPAPADRSGAGSSPPDAIIERVNTFFTFFFFTFLTSLSLEQMRWEPTPCSGLTSVQILHFKVGAKESKVPAFLAPG